MSHHHHAASSPPATFGSVPKMKHASSLSSSKKFSQPLVQKTSNVANSDSPVQAQSQLHLAGRTVKKLKLSRALTISEETTVSEACRRMTARRVNAVLLTDENALLSGILTDKDVARFIAEGFRPDETLVSKIMTPNPTFVSSDSLAIDALQTMVQGEFRHLPVVECGEVIGMLDITKCLYDAISRMEKAAEQGTSAIAAAVGGLESKWGSNVTARFSFIEKLREQIFKPSLSGIISENTKIASISPTDSVLEATKKMREMHSYSVVVVVENKIQGILTSQDILKRVVAQNMSPESTLVEKVLTLNPECATMETKVIDALHIMHEGKFLHLPVLDKDGNVAACVDVLQITHAALSLVDSNSDTLNEKASTMMQKFWDSALSLEPPEDYDVQSEFSGIAPSDYEQGKFATSPLSLGNSIALKFEDADGHIHRLDSAADQSLEKLVSDIMQKLGLGGDGEHPLILYEDVEGDKVLITTDSDLCGAVNYARSVGLKSLRLHLEFTKPKESLSSSSSESQSSRDTKNRTSSVWSSHRVGILAGVVVLTGITVAVYLKRTGQRTLF